MTILAENNALQNIGKCLTGQCKHQYEVADLLQFCTQIILYEKIHIVPFVPQDILVGSRGVISQLETFGIDMFSIEPPSVDADDGGLIKDVAKMLHADIDADVLKNEKKTEVGLMFFPKLSAKAEELINATMEAIANGDRDGLLADSKHIQRSSFSGGDSGFFKVLNCDIKGRETIREKIVTFSKSNGWNKQRSLYLLFAIRRFLNRSLATCLGEIYSPSVIRGTVEKERKITKSHPLTRFHIETMGKLGGIFEQGTVRSPSTSDIGVPDSIEPYVGELSIPSLIGYIVETSEGDVADALKIAWELRHTFSTVREMIGNANLFEVSKAVKEIEARVLRDVECQCTICRKHAVTTTVGANAYVVAERASHTPAHCPNAQKLDECYTAFTSVLSSMAKLDNHGSRSWHDLLTNCGIP